ncbi:bifunctional biotin--[acetyl-CoA-carboxylase] ligase/biotin operon repressor BirA [Aliikangiella coralliicola]|uniref:Bifunctional ligase/repressor BirA n=1 Tax=Aliikangiella coralliicola TaxID=2592383 RepID=A0A545U7U0_9GAMM|nr:bifunctional biotin--[acetyl-CoA-carboxylase] ligase/biotin operon repressor BirA [Aliikangiella coralliicola]TQV85528.1 bifunctional biotin--[acetyl-CoA-carboxylase] ligase/biotin operon repressor BirA [Aliikangiella coralliicola]
MSNRTILRTETLLRRLSDGKFHSGESLANELEISRTAVWKLIQKIESWQVEIYSVRGRGYQIPGGLDLLDQPSLQTHIEQNNVLFKKVIVLSSIDSTADFLARDWKKLAGVGRVCIAEHQSAGRGRKGRPWISPFGANLYFSVGVELPLGLSALGGLSLAVGISLCRTLNRFADNQVKIKWPNDLLVDDKKLAGILVEASGDTTDNSFLNIGVGINWNMQLDQGEAIDQPWVNLKDYVPDTLSRNQILESILIELDKALREYLQGGFTKIVDAWPELSAMYRRAVTIHLPKGLVQGKEVGIESNGALRLETENGIQIFHSGEVSLRKRNEAKH